MRLTFEVTGRRSSEAAEGTNQRSWLAVPLDRRVSPRLFGKLFLEKDITEYAEQKQL